MGFGALLLIAVLLVGLGVWVYRASGPACQALRRQSEADFKYRAYAAAYERVQPHAQRCADGERDPVERTRFTAVLATSAYGAGHQAEAKTHANRWRTWALSLGDYAPSSVVSSREAAAIMDVHLGKYALPQPNVGPQDKGKRVPQ